MLLQRNFNKKCSFKEKSKEKTYSKLDCNNVRYYLKEAYIFCIAYFNYKILPFKRLHVS